MRGRSEKKADGRESECLENSARKEEAAKTDALATIAPGHEDDPSGAELVKNRDAQDRRHK